MKNQLNAAKAYLEIREKYIGQVVDYAVGTFPPYGEETRWMGKSTSV